MANLFREGRQKIIDQYHSKERAGETATSDGEHNHKLERTALQRLVEDGEGKSLEEILTAPDKDLVRLTEKYHLSPSTLYQWRVRLGLTRGGILRKIGKV